MFRPTGALGVTVAGIVFFSGALALGDEQTVDVVKIEGLSRSESKKPLSPEEQTKTAEKIEARAKKSCEQQGKLLDKANNKKDIIQATCLEDKVVQCNANLESLQDRRKALEAAITAGDAGGRRHEFTVIGVLQQKFQILDHAASQCIGQDIFETGSTEVEMEVDPDSPAEDSTRIPATPEAPVPYIPPPVSATN